MPIEKSWTHFGRIAGIVMISLWVLNLYLVFSQWRDLKAPSADVVDGWRVTRNGGSIFNQKNSQIAKSLGKTGDGTCGWCTNCSAYGSVPPPADASCAPAPVGATSAPPKCAQECWGAPGMGQDKIGPEDVLPRGTIDPAEMTSEDDCRALCERQYNEAMGAPDKEGKVSTTNIENACNAWEWRESNKTCFTYVLASYPPRIETESDQVSSTGWALDKFKERVLMRQIAASLIVIAPLALFYVAYKNFYRVAKLPSMRTNILASAAPAAAAVAALAFLSFVGFTNTTPASQFVCNGALNQKCTADALTGGRTSGTCYNKCCGMTVSCLLPEPGPLVYSTCTWPNVMCKDGSCALNKAECAGHGGFMAAGVSERCYSGGAKAVDGADYGGGEGTSGTCYALSTIDNTNYPFSARSADAQLNDTPSKWTPTQYWGEPNRDLPPQIVADLGGNIEYLPPGRSDGKGPPTYMPFQMSENLNAFMGRSPKDANKPVWGCGMKTDPRTQRLGLYLQGSPLPLQCVVPSGVESEQ